MSSLKNKTLKVISAAFEHQGNIPSKYTCQGENINPPLTIGDIPGTAKGLTLIVDDPDAPGRTFDHWIVWNIPTEGHILENSIPGIEGINHYGIYHYKGPCPPSGTHRYFFKVYALDSILDLKVGTDKAKLEKEMEGHILSYGELIGLYKKT